MAMAKGRFQRGMVGTAIIVKKVLKWELSLKVIKRCGLGGV